MEIPSLSGWRFVAGILGIALLALVIRITAIEERPMHTDEAVHACILGEMLAGGLYKYNAQDCHGPTLYFLAWPVLKALGATSLATLEVWQLRVIPICIGVANILALSLFARELGKPAVLVGAVLMAVAAPVVYYDRYFIHESLFLFFTLLFLASLRRMCASIEGHDRSFIFWSACVGACVALLFSTKETAIITLGAASVAVVAGLDLVSVRRTSWSCLPWKEIACSLAVAMLTGAVIFTAFYTSFGLHLEGLTDSARAVPRFMNRATGEGHEKPWWTYLAWLLTPNRFSLPWAGWIIFGFALVGASLRWRDASVRFVATFACTNLAIYSLIPYKTPWLIMTVMGPMCLLAGTGLTILLQKLQRIPAICILLVLSALMIQETRRLCYQDPADDRNPYAYSPTVPDINGVARRLDVVAEAITATTTATHTPALPVLIYVVGADYWPMPWFLRKYPRVGYWREAPADMASADAVVASTDSVDAVQQRLGDGWTALPFGLRPGVLVFVFVRK